MWQCVRIDVHGAQGEAGQVVSVALVGEVSKMMMRRPSALKKTLECIVEVAQGL